MYTPKKYLSKQTWSFLENHSNMFCRCQNYVRSPIIYKKTNSALKANFLQPISITNSSISPVLNIFLQRNLSGQSKMPSIDEEFRHLTYSEVNEITRKGDSILIDVREKNELDETGTIPGSHHIPLGEVEKALLTPAEDFEKLYNFKKPNPEDSLVFSCRSGKRSLVALDKALLHGFTNAKHYSGGWLDWEKKTSEPK